MHLWLSPHDAGVQALKARGKLDFGFARTPFGECAALMSRGFLLALHFTADRAEGLASLQMKWPDSILSHATEADALAARAFEQPDSIPLMAIGTPFQLTVWEHLCSIPKGTTRTYGEVAKALGRPTAARAVGQAVGANEIAILIPCHRVVSPGKLTGYRWGIERKKALLAW